MKRAGFTRRRRQIAVRPCPEQPEPAKRACSSETGRGGSSVGLAFVCLTAGRPQTPLGLPSYLRFCPGLSPAPHSPEQRPVRARSGGPDWEAVHPRGDRFLRRFRSGHGGLSRKRPFRFNPVGRKGGLRAIPPAAKPIVGRAPIPGRGRSLRRSGPSNLDRPPHLHFSHLGGLYRQLR